MTRSKLPLSWRRYRYYKLKEKPIAEDAMDRIPAHEIENHIEEAIRKELSGFDSAASLLNINPAFQPDLIQAINKKQVCIPDRDIVLKSVEKVVIDQTKITVFVKIEKLSQVISENLYIVMPKISDETKEINVPYIFRRAHRGAIVIEPDRLNAEKDPLDLPSGELRNLVRGMIWRDEHFGGMTLRDIAKRERFSEGYVGRCIFRTFETSLA